MLYERTEILPPDPQFLSKLGIPPTLTEVLGAIRVCVGERVLKEVVYTSAMPLPLIRQFGGVPHFSETGELEAAFHREFYLGPTYL